MTEEEELNAIRRVLDGETDAFEALVTHYQSRLIRMLATLLHDRRRLAEDVAQDVLVEAFRRLGSFDPSRSRFSTWLFLIAKSRGINALKKKSPTLIADPPEQVGGTENTVREREELGLLDRALHQLPIAQKRAFVLGVIEGLPQAEVAQLERTTIGTIKSRISRAREYLKTTLNEQRK